jgi:hypothetical protein
MVNRQKSAAGPIATLGDLARHGAWVTLTCHRCQHSVAIPLAPFRVRWGLEASSDTLRRNFRCTQCGTRSTGVTVSAPVNAETDGQAFPVERGYMAPKNVAQRSLARIGVR